MQKKKKPHNLLWIKDLNIRPETVKLCVAKETIKTEKTTYGTGKYLQTICMIKG